MILGQHGLINWADDDKACYDLTLDLIEKAARYIAERDKGDADLRRAEVPVARRGRRATPACSQILPWLRGQVSQRAALRRHDRHGAGRRGHRCEFVNSHDAPRLAELGTSCPDHFLRTKIKPLYVAWDPRRATSSELKSPLDGRPGAVPRRLRRLLRSLQAPRFAGHARRRTRP